MEDKKMEYKYSGVKFIFDSFSDNGFIINIEDNVGLINSSRTDTYILEINYENTFIEDCLYLEENIDSVINGLCDKLDNELRNSLPEDDYFDEYKRIEGYWECMGLAREACRKPLMRLWENEHEEQMSKCESIIEKIGNCNSDFTDEELNLIKRVVKDELVRLREDLELEGKRKTRYKLKTISTTF